MNKGNGEYYFEWGVKTAVGVHTEKRDDTQINETEVSFSNPFSGD